tara:strand:- start:11188 stop:14328 length:3141 start_codon:yes stop_codon:yes gene_type:complete
MRIIHLADVHWRGLSRHDEYRESFTSFFNEAKKLNPDVIYVGGDIVHSKTQGISPELIDNMCWWFKGLSSIAPTHVILGNHDGLILNKSRQDAISPILSALDDPNIHLYKNSGTYPTGIPGFNWCVFSCFDEEGWKDVRPVKDEVSIALFHGAVWGSKTDIDWSIEGDVDDTFFEEFDFTLLGDIHKVQYLNERKTMAYCGSTIQQNYGEDPGKGFLFWDIKDRDNFTSKFYEVKHTKPFITIDWNGSVKNALIESAKYINGARFRIKSDQCIAQTTARELQNELMTFKDAAEVVFKSESSFSSAEIQTKSGDSLTKENLRDPSTHKKLLREYYGNTIITKQKFDKLDQLIDKYLSQISLHDEKLRNVRWQIHKFEFDNTFAYGKNNVINFDNLPGITGIFGKNAKGKSSIIGSLVYGLYNTTDRGSIKNIHVINNRKNYCRAAINFSMNGKFFRLERKTIKKQTRKGSVYATTELSLHETDELGNIIADLCEEQRRETEKIVRNMIGISEDFLMTSLASQGQMNTFIRERATSRKAILTNFLDLNIFEKMYDLAKDESYDLRSKAKIMPHADWDTLIDEQQIVMQSGKEDLRSIEKLIASKRDILEKLNIDLATSGNPEIVTQQEADQQKIIVDKNLQNVEILKKELLKNKSDIHTERKKILRIKRVKNDFPIHELRNQLESQRELEKTLLNLEHDHERQKTLLLQQERSVQKLLDVPCGDQFLTCKFIKESHLDKKRIDEQKLNVENLAKNLIELKDAFQKIKNENLEDKIRKFDKILEKEAALSVNLSGLEVEKNNLENKVRDEKRCLDESSETLDSMKARVVDVEKSSEDIKLRNNIVSLKSEINDLDHKKLSIAEKITRSNVEISRLKSDHKEFKSIKHDLKIYEMFIQAMSKKGIPLQIMMTQLPIINTEIAKILHGVTGFTVELEADSDSNAMDIYINYGDSKRIIELASGMEKMMSSLAIRVALINVSSLPKTNMLIIDEGFGSLDETNIEACSRLLESLKKWFKNIIIISHVDAIKDAVDNSIEIFKNEKDAKVMHE